MISGVESEYQLRDQVRMLRRFVDSGQHWARHLALAAARRSVAIGKVFLSILLLFEVVFDLFLQQTQV